MPWIDVFAQRVIAQGDATVFDSHAWKYEFEALINALQLFQAGEETDSRQHFHWLDILTVNQDPTGQATLPQGISCIILFCGHAHHPGFCPSMSTCCAVKAELLTTFATDYFYTTFKEGIQAIGHTLLVLSPWSAPLPLRRSWCLWEILCTIQDAGVRFSVQLSEAEEKDFLASEHYPSFQVNSFISFGSHVNVARRPCARLGECANRT